MNEGEYLCSYYHTPSQEELQSSIYVTWSGHRRCRPTHNIGPRVLPSYKFVLIVRGSGFYVLDEQPMLLRAGDGFFLFPQVKHQYYANQADPWELEWVAFNGTSCATLVKAMRVHTQNPILRGVMTKNLLSHLDCVIASMAVKREMQLEAVGNLYLLFHEILRIRQNEAVLTQPACEDEAMMQKIMTFISLNYTNDLNVDLVRSHVNYSRSYFSHFFKRKMGMSLPQYINQLRMKKAKELLCTTDLRISEVASSIGYCDAFYFSRLFRQYSGLSPQLFRHENTAEALKQSPIESGKEES